MSPDAVQSYHRFMREQLFSGINIAPKNCFIPRGEARSTEQIESDCADYEREIAARGGLDFQLLGIGRNGHIGFNEPGSAQNSRTRLVTLDSTTRSDAASDFFDLENAPACAITLGIATILEAREIGEDLVRKCDDDAHLPENKVVLCLSPHPDDDVICCGATLLKMAARGNKLFVAYGVSGANAVRDKDVLGHLRARHPRLIAYLEENLEPGKPLEDAMNEVRTGVFERESGQPDAPLLRNLKRLVREGEAAAGCRKMGAKPVFLDLPFYGDGVNRHPLSEADVAKTRVLLDQMRPDLVLLTGEHNDPHGTHETCETCETCEQAFNLAAQDFAGTFKRWSYRGAWNDYQTWEGDYFSVFDKAMMDRKIDLNLDHISQLDPLFPATKPWNSGSARASATAKTRASCSVWACCPRPEVRAALCRSLQNGVTRFQPEARVRLFPAGNKSSLLTAVRSVCERGIMFRVEDRRHCAQRSYT